MPRNDGAVPPWQENHNGLQHTIDRLHRRALRCRELSERAVSASMAAEFEALARDYEIDAQRLEARSSTNRREAVRND